MEVVGALVTVSGLIVGVTKIANSVTNIKEKWRYAPLNISMVSTSLWAIKAALESIAEWRSSVTDDSEQSEQLDKNLEVCIESCAVMVAVVENRLKDIDLENISKFDKARFVNLDTLFKDFASNLRAQVDALQLLLTIYQCRSLSEQNKQLQQAKTKNAVSAVRQSTAGLPYEDKDIEDAASILSETPSATFTFDKIIMQHQHYSRTYPKLYQRMQQKFPSRNPSVASTIKRNVIKPKRRPVQAIDPLVDQNISLPFLGLPFHGEALPDETEEPTIQDALTPTDEKRLDAIGEYENPEPSNEPTPQSLHETIRTQPPSTTSSPTTLADRVLAEAPKSMTSRLDVTVASENVVEDNRSTRNQDGLLASPRRRRKSSNALPKHQRKSFDSLYDISDDGAPGNPHARSSVSKPGAEKPVQLQHKSSDLGPSKPSVSHLSDSAATALLDRRSSNEGSALSARHTTASQTGEKQQSLTSNIKADEVIKSVSLSHETNRPVMPTQMTLPVKNTSSSDNYAMNPETDSAKNLPLNFMKFDFGPDLDLNIATHHASNRTGRNISKSAPAFHHEDSAATLGAVAAAETLGTSGQTEMDPDDGDPHSLPAPVPPDFEPEQEPQKLSQSLLQTPRINTFVPPEDVAEDSIPATTKSISESLSPLQPPPRPTSVSSIPSHSWTSRRLSEAVPSDQLQPWPKQRLSEATIPSQMQTWAPQRSLENLPDRPTSYASPRLDHFNNEEGSRNSFQSDSSRYFQVPASPISLQSQHLPSSITSAESSFLTREQSANNTPTTSVTGPPPLSPRLIIDPVQHEKKRAVLTKNLAKFAHKANPASNRLSALPGLLSLRGSERSAKAKELASVVQSGDSVKLTLLVQQYDKLSDLSVPTSIGDEITTKTALMRAASLNHIDCAQVLLSCDPGSAACVDKQGKTALHHAFENGSYTTALWLTSQLCKSVEGRFQYKGKDGQKIFEMPDSQGVSPAHLAAQAPDHSILEVLVMANTNMFTKSANHWNILHYAVAARRFDNVRYIIRHGLADVNGKTLRGETPLILAAIANDELSLSILLENGADKDILDCLGNTALHHAASHGNMAIVETLFQSMKDVTAKNFIGEQPLHLAAAGNHTEVLIALLGIPGIQPNIWTEPPHLKQPVNRSEGFAATAKLASTPLHYACASGHHEAADILISRGAMVNANQEDGYSLLMMACQAQSSAIVSLLLLQGADPKGSTEKEGLTALHVACRVDDLVSTRLLLEYGADVLARTTTKWKETASMLAFRENGEGAKGAAYYTMRYRQRVLKANEGQYASDGVLHSAANNPPGIVTYAPNVRNPNQGYLVPSQYTGFPVQPQVYYMQPQHPMATAAAPMPAGTATADNEPPPPYQR